MIFGVGLYSWVLEILSQNVVNESSHQVTLQSYKFVIDEMGDQSNFGKGIRKRIRQALQTNYNKNLVKPIEKEELIEDLPLSLQHQLFMEIYNKRLKTIPFFRKYCDKELLR